MVCKIIFRFNIEDTKIHQMLEALEHPLGSPRIFEAKERGECFAPLLLTISKIESVKLKYVIIAKMDLKVIENGLQNNFLIQH